MCPSIVVYLVCGAPLFIYACARARGDRSPSRLLGCVRSSACCRPLNVQRLAIPWMPNEPTDLKLNLIGVANAGTITIPWYTCMLIVADGTIYSCENPPRSMKTRHMYSRSIPAWLESEGNGQRLLHALMS